MGYPLGIGLPLIVVSGFWFLIGGVVPFIIKGENKAYLEIFFSQLE